MEQTNVSRIGAMLAAAIGVALAGCDEIRGLANADAIKGNGVERTETRPVGNFSQIEAGGALKVTVVEGQESKVEVKADENLLPFVLTEVEGGILKISMKKGSYNPTVPMEAILTAPNLTRLSLAGASQGKVEGLEADSLELVASGASKIEWSGSVGNLLADASGASSIKVGKVAGDADVRATGASKVDVAGKAGKVKAEASGASHVALEAAADLDANASGASSVLYEVKPERLSERASGASRVAKK